MSFIVRSVNDPAEVRSIAVTKSLIDLEDAEDFIVFAARVSNPENQMNSVKGDKLIKYLIKHGHWSPFEMANLVLEITTTRDIGRQILRHSFKFQEFSQRYSDPTTALGFQLREARLQDVKNKQNSLEVDDPKLQAEWENMQLDVIEAASRAYDWATKNNIAKEQKRVVLPEGLTLSRLYVNGYVRTWIHYCMARMHKSTQKEHRILAQKCWAHLGNQFPTILEAHNTLFGEDQ